MSVALCAPMNPPPFSTKLTMAAFWLASNGNSPVVRMNANTSTVARRTAVICETSSVAVMVNSPVRLPSAVSVSRAVSIDPWRKPVVAVSISTRSGATDGVGWGTNPPRPSPGGVVRSPPQPTASTSTKTAERKLGIPPIPW